MKISKAVKILKPVIAGDDLSANKEELDDILADMYDRPEFAETLARALNADAEVLCFCVQNALIRINALLDQAHNDRIRAQYGGYSYLN